MITIDDPKLQDILTDFKRREIAVLCLVVLSVLVTVLVISQNAWIGHARSVYTVALIWIIAAATITYTVTVREIERIQQTQQTLDFRIHNIAVSVHGDAALRQLSKLAKRANGAASSIKQYVYFVAGYSVLFGVANVMAVLPVDPAIIKFIRNIEAGLADLIRLYFSTFETRHVKFILMDIAIVLQVLLVGFVICYDRLLHEMNHEMKRAYKPEVFTDKAATLYAAGDTDREETINNIRSVKLDLEIATLSLIAIDCPVFVGVTATALLEIYFIFLGLPDPLHLFAIGISTGALALHIIAANVMFMILPRLDASNLTPRVVELATERTTT